MFGFEQRAARDLHVAVVIHELQHHSQSSFERPNCSRDKVQGFDQARGVLVAVPLGIDRRKSGLSASTAACQAGSLARRSPRISTRKEAKEFRRASGS